MDVRDELNVVYTLLTIGLMSGRDDMVTESRDRLGKVLEGLNDGAGDGQRLILNPSDDGADQIHDSKVDEGLEGR